MTRRLLLAVALATSLPLTAFAADLFFIDPIDLSSFFANYRPQVFAKNFSDGSTNTDWFCGTGVTKDGRVVGFTIGTGTDILEFMGGQEGEDVRPVGLVRMADRFILVSNITVGTGADILEVRAQTVTDAGVKTTVTLPGLGGTRSWVSEYSTLPVATFTAGFRTIAVGSSEDADGNMRACYWTGIETGKPTVHGVLAMDPLCKVYCDEAILSIWNNAHELCLFGVARGDRQNAAVAWKMDSTGTLAPELIESSRQEIFGAGPGGLQGTRISSCVFPLCGGVFAHSTRFNPRKDAGPHPASWERVAPGNWLPTDVLSWDGAAMATPTYVYGTGTHTDQVVAGGTASVGGNPLTGALWRGMPSTFGKFPLPTTLQQAPAFDMNFLLSPSATGFAPPFAGRITSFCDFDPSVAVGIVCITQPDGSTGGAIVGPSGKFVPDFMFTQDGINEPAEFTQDGINEPAEWILYSGGESMDFQRSLRAETSKGPVQAVQIIAGIVFDRGFVSNPEPLSLTVSGEVTKVVPGMTVEVNMIDPEGGIQLSLGTFSVASTAFSFDINGIPSVAVQSLVDPKTGTAVFEAITSVGVNKRFGAKVTGFLLEVAG